jgi:hypothetical protein
MLEWYVMIYKTKSGMQTSNSVFKRLSIATAVQCGTARAVGRGCVARAVPSCLGRRHLSRHV